MVLDAMEMTRRDFRSLRFAVIELLEEADTETRSAGSGRAVYPRPCGILNPWLEVCDMRSKAALAVFGGSTDWKPPFPCGS